MRTVSGPTDHVVVVGAGLGGLSAALRLVGAGRRVTVVEREPRPGGRAGLYVADGFRFDTGPTVLTMPELADEALACIGERLADRVELVPLSPAYRAFFPDGSTLDVLTGVEAMAAEVARVCGPREADGYRRYVTFLRRLYRLEMGHFIDRNYDSPLGLLAPSGLPALARLVAVGGFRRLAPKLAGYFRDPRTRRVFGFQAMYAGLSPYQALALYAVISYMDTVAGVYVPHGGMHALPEALAGAAADHGVEFRYGTAVTGVERRGGRAIAVRTADGDRIACDVLVLGGDLPVMYRDLLGVAPPPARYSPSCFLLQVGSSRAYTKIAHHNVHFGTAWRAAFDDLLRARRTMRDPSVFVSAPTVTDSSLAPAGQHIYSTLVPVPNLEAGIDWEADGERYRDEVLDLLETRGYKGFRAGVTVMRVTTPADWRRLGMERGTPFAAAHTFGQTGPFRAPNVWGENIVFTGSGTVPGVGIPMVLISGRLAAARVLG